MRRPRAATEGSQESPRWRGCVLLHARLHSPAVRRLCAQTDARPRSPPPFSEESEETERPAPSPGGDYAEVNQLLRTLHFELRARRASLVRESPPEGEAAA